MSDGTSVLLGQNEKVDFSSRSVWRRGLRAQARRKDRRQREHSINTSAPATAYNVKLKLPLKLLALRRYNFHASAAIMAGNAQVILARRRKVRASSIDIVLVQGREKVRRTAASDTCSACA